MNSFRKFLFRAYALYEAHSPIHLGNYQISQVLYALFGLATFEIEGFKIQLNPVAAIDRSLILGRSHDETVAACIKEMKDGSYLDIGANIGYFCLMASSRGIPSYAFEPSTRELVRMNQNIAVNNFKNITVFHAGISDKKEQLALQLGQDFNPGQNSVLTVVDSKESELADFAPLSTYLSKEELQTILLCKIDVEGFELNVLQGMEDCMQYLTKADFVVEITPKFLAHASQNPADIYSFFERHGYTPRFGLDTSARKYDEVFSRT
jgi:FkbM family methyltransferase